MAPKLRTKMKILHYRIPARDIQNATNRNMGEEHHHI
jgi:hypothetical protein